MENISQNNEKLSSSTSSLSEIVQNAANTVTEYVTNVVQSFDR